MIFTTDQNYCGGVLTHFVTRIASVIEGDTPMQSVTSCLTNPDEVPSDPLHVCHHQLLRLSRRLPFMTVLGCLMEGRLLSVSQMREVAALPALPVLYSTLLGTLGAQQQRLRQHLQHHQVCGICNDMVCSLLWWFVAFLHFRNFT